MTEQGKYRRRKGRECTITVKMGKLLLSAAAGESFGCWADLYEAGPVMALVPVAEGDLHLISNSSRSARKDISCQSLYSYLREKYALEDRGKLAAWLDSAGVLLFGLADAQGAGRSFDERFQKCAIPIEQNERCSVFRNHGAMYISRAAAARLPKRVSAYVRGGVLCLSPDPKGRLILTDQPHSAKAIFSRSLIAYLGEKFGQDWNSLPARLCGGRLYFSADLPEAEQDFEAFRRLDLHMTPAAWITLMKNGTVRLSAAASNYLHCNYVAFYECGTICALAPDDDGRGLLLNRRQGVGGAVIGARALYTRIAQLLACEPGDRLNTVLQDDVVYFSSHPLPGRLELTSFARTPIRAYYSSRVSLLDNGLSFGRSTRDYLPDRFSAYIIGGTVTLLIEPDGDYRINRKGCVLSQPLAQFLKGWAGPGRDYLYAAPVKNGVALLRGPEDEDRIGAEYETPAPLSMFLRDWGCLHDGNSAGAANAAPSYASKNLGGPGRNGLPSAGPSTGIATTQGKQ